MKPFIFSLCLFGIALAAPMPDGSQPKNPDITINGQICTANSAGVYNVEGQSLTPGGPPITVHSDVFSLAPSATAVYCNGSPTPILQPPPGPAPEGTTPMTPAITPPPRPPPADAASFPPFTFGGEVYTANSAGDYLIQGQTLTPGGPPITIDNIPISLCPSATKVYVNGNPTPLANNNRGLPPTTDNGSGAIVKADYCSNDNQGPPPTTTLAQIGYPGPITFSGSIYTANSMSKYIIQGSTLSPGGPAMTIDGHTLSLFPSCTAIMVDGVTTSITAVKE